MDDESHVLKNASIKQVEAFFKTIVNKLEERYEKDPVNYEKAITSLVKNQSKLVKSNDATIQKALHSWQKNDIFAIKKGKKTIPVQNTVRRQNTKRGKNASKPGPTKRRAVEKNKESEQTANQGTEKGTKRKPRSLADLVESNIPPRKKH